MPCTWTSQLGERTPLSSARLATNALLKLSTTREAPIEQFFRSLADRRLLIAFSLVVLFLVPRVSFADAGLIIETPTGLLGFLSNVGHVSIWISHGCLDPDGRITYCENSAGLVLTSTAYWPNPGAAAIPAELFFLGTQRGVAGRDRAAWTRTLGDVYQDVPSATGAKYFGRAWLRSLRVLKFATSPEDDRRVLAEIDAAQRGYRYSYSSRNCAFYAQSILQRYFGQGFHGNRILEFGIDTPRAVERALRHELKEQAVDYEVIRFKGDFRHAWRQPSRNICESAIFDPKYAIPLVMYQPYLYAGFAGCYVAIRLSEWSRRRSAILTHADPVLPAHSQPGTQQMQAYEALTGIAARHFAGFASPASLMAESPESVTQIVTAGPVN